MHFALLGVYVTALMWPQVPQLQSASATVSVAGRIVDAESRSPIPGARVMLMPTAPMFPPGAAGPLQAVTDANGQFVFEAVAPGRYRIDAQKTGFAPLAAAAAPRTLDVAAGQVTSRLDLALTKGGAITGRIVDASGEPASDVTVTALRQTAGPSGQVMARTLGMAQTNDLGEFRLAGLTEGNYVVIAAPLPQLAQSTATAGGTVLAPTYYPGTTSKDGAHIISLAAAQTVNGIEFSLLSMRAYQVSGVVVDETGSPLGGAMITLRADLSNGSLGVPTMARTDQNGTFRIGGVVSGTYRVMAGMSTPTMWSVRTGSTAAGGGVDAGITGGVYFGGANVGGPAVSPPAMALITPVEVTIDNADVTDLKVVLTARK
jgi:hypothetical protein